MITAREELEHLIRDCLPAENPNEQKVLRDITRGLSETEAAALLGLIERAEEQTCQERGV